jgi:hypothetical protein
MKKLEVIVEKNDGLLWGRVQSENWMPAPYGATVHDVVENLKELVADYALHEGKNDSDWNNIDWKKVEIVFKYDLAAFFETFNYLNLSAISAKIGINRTLLNHYKTGIKYASAKQVRKIEDAIHAISHELGNVKLVA